MDFNSNSNFNSNFNSNLNYFQPNLIQVIIIIIKDCFINFDFINFTN